MYLLLPTALPKMDKTSKYFKMTLQPSRLLWLYFICCCSSSMHSAWPSTLFLPPVLNTSCQNVITIYRHLTNYIILKFYRINILFPHSQGTSNDAAVFFLYISMMTSLFFHIFHKQGYSLTSVISLSPIV